MSDKPKRKKSKSPLQRTLGRLRDAGWIVGITEKFNPFVKVRQDYCGFADCIAFKVGEPILAINAMHLKHKTEHEHLRDNHKLYVWLSAGHKFNLHQWTLRGPRGEKKRWELDIDRWSVDRMSKKAAQSPGERSDPESLSNGKTDADNGRRTGRRSRVVDRTTAPKRVGTANLVGEKHSR